MATIASALNTAFTPAASDFIAQVSGGSAVLRRRGTSGAAWTDCGTITNGSVIVSNPVTGASYMFVSSENVTVQADQ